MKNENTTSDCPKVEELRRYLSGDSSGFGFDSLDQHIDSCHSCQDKLESLRQHSDLLTNIIAEVNQLPSAKLGEGLQKSLENIRSRQSGPKDNRVKSQTTGKITIIRDYQIVESIGEGGMGCVYRAVDIRQNRHVAIKILRQDRVNSEEAISRFYREMKVLEQLKHPNIVEALEAGEQDGLQFLVMEFLAGVDVGQLCKRLGPLPVSDACEIVRMAALALQQAHDQNILHRDVKPSNLRVTPDGVVKLLDLGLAHFCDFSQPSLSRSDQAIGTLAYMAPEQFSRKEEITPRSDIFSLGVTFHEILTGQRPLERPGQAPVQTELMSVRPDVDETLIGLITEMISVSSARRPQTMGEIVNRLAPYAATSNLASLVMEYFNWNTKKPPGTEPVIPPPIVVEFESTTISRMNAIAPHQKELINRRQLIESENGMSAKSMKTKYLAWPICIAATVFFLALGYWLWPRPDTDFPQIVVDPAIPLPVTTGELDLIPDGEIAIQLLADGAVFITNLKTGKISTVTTGVNSLESGTYSITFDGPEDFKALDDIQIVKGEKRTRRLTTSLTKQFAFPTIAEKAGAFAAYKGTLWLKGWPDTEIVSFQIRLHVLSVEEQDTRPKFVWLKVETTTQHADGDYCETGYLKINLDRWKSENFLDVEEGFVRASGERISQMVQDRVIRTNKRDLVVPFLKERDWLREIAFHALPEHRLSLHDFLALFFGDDSIRAATETIRELRPRLLSSGDRNAWIESFQDSFGGRVPCYVASSRLRETDRQTPGYIMARTKEEPFGFVRMEAKMPSLLKATCAITNSGTATIDKNELVLAQQDCIDPNEIGRRSQFWSNAGLPAKEGETTWHGAVEIAGSPRQIVEVTARSLGTESEDDRACRWVEIEVSSTLAQGEDKHWEAARLLVDVEEYRDFGRFDAKRGWLSFGDPQTVFALPENGDLTEVFDQRMMLFDTPNFHRFGVIDVLALFFDAEFKPPSSINVLKRQIAADCVGLSPERTEVPIPKGSAPAVKGEIWEYPAPAPVKYTIRRTPHILFDVVDVSLKRGEVNIALSNKSTGPLIQTSSITPKIFTDRQTETQLRVKETIKPNWRLWTWNYSGTSYEAWAEFGGNLGTGINFDDRSKREVLLRARNGQEIRVPCNVLSDDDWNWARKGRVWKAANANTVEAQYNLVEVLRDKITLQGIDGEKYSRDFKTLSDEEQTWVDSYKSATRQRYHPSQQTQEWSDFAQGIRSINR